MNDAEYLWNIAAAAKNEAEKAQQALSEALYQRAQTHLVWVIEKIMKPAALKGRFSISNYDLPDTQDSAQFTAACVAKGFHVKTSARGRRFDISWDKKETVPAHGGAYGPDE